MKLPETINVSTSETVVRQLLNLIEEHDIGVIEAATMFSENSGLDIEFIGDVIRNDGLLLSMIEEEAERLHFIKPIPRLDLE